MDYYRSVTGTPEPEYLEDPDGSGVAVKILRVRGVHEVMTCRECWETPSARVALERAWSTGWLGDEG